MTFAEELQGLMELDYKKSAEYLAEAIVQNECESIKQKCKAFAARGLKVLIYRCSNQLTHTFEDEYLKAIHALWTMTPDHPVEGHSSFKDMVADVVEAKLCAKFDLKATCRLDLLSLRNDPAKLIAQPINHDPIYEESVLYQAAIKMEWT